MTVRWELRVRSTSRLAAAAGVSGLGLCCLEESFTLILHVFKNRQNRPNSAGVVANASPSLSTRRASPPPVPSRVRGPARARTGNRHDPPPPSCKLNRERRERRKEGPGAPVQLRSAGAMGGGGRSALTQQHPLSLTVTPLQLGQEGEKWKRTSEQEEGGVSRECWKRKVTSASRGSSGIALGTRRAPFPLARLPDEVARPRPEAPQASLHAWLARLRVTDGATCTGGDGGACWRAALGARRPGPGGQVTASQSR